MSYPGAGNSGLTTAAVQGVTNASESFVNEGTVPTLTGTGIAFVAPDTITDSGNGLAVFNAGQMIEVSHATLNSNIYKVKTVAAGTITVYEQIVADEAAGALIELRQGG